VLAFEETSPNFPSRRSVESVGDLVF